MRVPEDCKKMLVLAGRNFCARFGRAGVLPMSVSASESCLFPVGRVRVVMEGGERKGGGRGAVLRAATEAVGACPPTTAVDSYIHQLDLMAQQ